MSLLNIQALIYWSLCIQEHSMGHSACA